MAILLLGLFFITLVFLFYYELLWKNFEKEKKKNLLSIAGEYAFADTAVTTGRRKKRGKYKKRDKTPWGDWRYRVLVELHRRGQINPQEGAEITGVSTRKIEDYLDELEGEGKVQSAGDSKRGIFYRIVSEA
jgi:type IV secretory pathway TraG/TraD family ATPase VirD4